MRYTNESKNISAKTLKHAIDCIDNLTEAAAEVAAVFHTYQMIVEETGIPADPQMIEECSQMFATMNKMMLRQKADLQHLRMMQKSMAQGEKILKDLKDARKKEQKSSQQVAVA